MYDAILRSTGFALRRLRHRDDDRGLARRELAHSRPQYKYWNIHDTITSSINDDLTLFVIYVSVNEIIIYLARAGIRAALCTIDF